MKAATTRKLLKSGGTTPSSGLIRHAEKSPQSSVTWIRELATPYLKGYKPKVACEAGLQGYWFIADMASVSNVKSVNRPSRRAPKREWQVGFFVGYLANVSPDYVFLRPEPPECLIFAWISPVDSSLHERLVKQPGSLVRKVFEYIRWLTHRPPRFVFHEAEAAAMTRHASMAGWPQRKREHLSRNFFIETLAWLVRSGLVRKLREEAQLGNPPRNLGQ